MKIDINSDMGESYGRWELGRDAEIMDWVSSINVACGFHAGDPTVMAQTVALAKQKGVAVGAHPAYPDLQGFGRRKMDMTPDEIEAMVLYQIGALAAFAKANGTELTHVKAHGMLYNVAAVERAVADAIARAIARFDRNLPMVVLATSPLMIEAGLAAGLKIAREAFADRAYNADGTLVSRRLPGSLITNPNKAADQVLQLVKNGTITAMDGTTIELQADTVCIHGDGPTALEVAQTVKQRITEAGISLAPLQG